MAGTIHLIDDSPLGSGKEIEDMCAQELHNELNNKPMLSLMASRLGMVANLLEKQNLLLEQLAAKN